ncbi:hypothetical protein GJ496_010884 [Pomphorhynchus laevis]|nr:hypothetical protein GJ496_010884 [Pomphorhynchus laevis]
MHAGVRCGQSAATIFNDPWASNLQSPPRIFPVDARGAVRILSCDHTIVQPDESTLSIICSKHPTARHHTSTPTIIAPEIFSSNYTDLNVTTESFISAIRSY